MPLTSLLEEALENWEFARQGVIAELRNLPAKVLSWRPADGARTVTELVHHIVESGLMMSGELTRPRGDFRRRSFAAHIREYGRGVARHRTRPALLALLKNSHADGARRIRRAGELHMLQHIRRFDGLLGTRLAWMCHGIAHEEYHRGQLALYARSMGRVPALTRAIGG